MGDWIEPDARDDEDEGLGSRGRVAGMASGAALALLTAVSLFVALAILSTVLKS